MRKILGGTSGQAPATLTLATSCPPLPQGGNEAIAQWIDRNPDARMVVIDVFTKMRGPSPPGASAYDADYAEVGHAKRIADHYGLAMVLVHHVRKAGSDDFLTEVSGTNGLAGAADATLVLKRARGQADGVLHVTGRDVDETEYAVRFYAEAGAWQLLEGPAADTPSPIPARRSCATSAPTAMTSHSRHSVTDVTLPHLFLSSEVAAALGCSEWWVKEQARQRRIPFTRAGGAYRLTAEHFAEIIRSFEERPVAGLELAPDVSPRRSPRRPGPTPTARLRAKRPRRASRPSAPTLRAA